MSEPSPMGRARPDGYHLEWVLSKPSNELRGILPFLIEDVTPREERVPRLTTHQNQATGLETLALAVEDSSSACQWHADVLHDDGAEIECVELAAVGRRFVLGTHRLDILSPRASGGFSTTG